MGPVRHKQLIQVLAFVVAIDMAIGVVAVYARGDRATTVTAAAPLSQSGTAPAGLASATGGAGGGILAGAQFRNRRRSIPVAESGTAAAPATDATTPGSPGTSPSSVAPTTAGTARPRASSTGSSGRAAPATPGRPTTTMARPAPSGATGTGAGGPVTTPAPDPGFTGSPPGGEDPANPVHPGGGSTGGGATGGGSTGSTATTATTRSSPSGPKTPRLTIPDPTGDTVLEGTTTRASQPRADLVESQANYTVKALLLTAKTADTVQPKDDPRWISESTFVSWEIDTNRDGAVDYEVQFFFADGTLVAGVSRPGDSESQSACAAEAGQTADGYTVGVDPGCIGNPGSFAYRVTTYYDLDPANETANDVVTDVAPDGGWSQPVSRP